MPLGIPDRSIKEVPRITEPTEMRLAIQSHLADKAGPHFDLRIVDPSNNKAYSFATRHLPTIPGDKTLAKLQPTHTAQYATWEGTIPEGYGAGTVKLFSEDKIELTKADPEHITFNVYKSNGDTSRYALIKTDPSKPDDYLFYNTTPTRQTRPYVPNYKPKYTSTNINSIDVDSASQYLAPKLDGAHSIFVLRAGKPIEAYSYRQSRKGANKLIDHSFRTGLYKVVTPKGLKGTTILRGELHNEDTKLTTPLLISNVWKSRADQVSAKDPLKATVFDVIQYGGQHYENKPYKDKLGILRKVTSVIPQLKFPTLATTPNAKRRLLESVITKQHPETKEGVVVYDLNNPIPMKAKLQEDFDVLIKDTFPGQGKYKDSVGGFTYAFPNNPTKVIGRVGTGFTDEERQRLKDYIGQVARVWSQEQLRSGALRAPAFKDIRPDMYKASVEKVNSPLFNKEDFTVRDGVSVAIRNPKDPSQILMVDHVKLNRPMLISEKVDSGESLEDAMARGLREELGIEPIEFKHLGHSPNDYVINNIPVSINNHVFEVSKFKGNIKNIEPHKHRSIFWANKDHISKLPLTSDGTKLWLEKS